MLCVVTLVFALFPLHHDGGLFGLPVTSESKPFFFKYVLHSSSIPSVLEAVRLRTSQSAMHAYTSVLYGVNAYAK